MTNILRKMLASNLHNFRTVSKSSDGRKFAQLQNVSISPYSIDFIIWVLSVDANC